MKSFLKEKKIHLITLFTSLVFIALYFWIMLNSGKGLSLEFIIGFLKPGIVFALAAFLFAAFFLFFPATLFMSWLKKIASWYLPVLFIVTVTTPVNSGHIMSVDRSQVVFAGMIILGIITLVYVGLDFYRKGKI